MENTTNKGKEGRKLDVNRFEELLGKLDVPQGRSKEEAWELFTRTVEQNKTARTRQLRVPVRLILAVAASVALVFGAWFTYKVTEVKTHTTGNGQMATITLPDNSIVHLNAASEVSYKPFGWGSKRVVVLQGEAFFEVEKGNTFEVKSGSNAVTVLGTSFNVYCRDNRFDVKCFTGKVRVANPSISPVVLTPGMAIALVAGSSTAVSSHFEPGAEVSWVQGNFYFTNQSLGEVFDEMERQFGITIESPALSGRMYSGFFSKKNLRTALDNVCLPMGLNYSIVDSVRVVVR